MQVLVSILEQEWFGIILASLATGIAGIITYMLSLVLAWLSGKVKDEKIKRILNITHDLIASSVNAVQQTMVSQLKKDGKFDKEAQKRAFEKVMLEVKENTSQETKKIITEVFGDFDMWLSNQIESLILRKKG